VLWFNPVRQLSPTEPLTHSRTPSQLDGKALEAFHEETHVLR